MRWCVLAGLQLKLMPRSPCSWGLGPGAWVAKKGDTDTVYTCSIKGHGPRIARSIAFHLMSLTAQIEQVGSQWQTCCVCCTIQVVLDRLLGGAAILNILQWHINKEPIEQAVLDCDNPEEDIRSSASCKKREMSLGSMLA